MVGGSGCNHADNRENSAMRKNFTLGLAVLALAGSIAGISRAELAPITDRTAEPSNLWASQGGSTAGFSAINADKSKSLKSDAAAALFTTGKTTSGALLHPEKASAWRHGFEALTPAFLRDLAPGESASALRAARRSEAELANAKGFAAIKAAASLPGAASPDLKSLLSGTGSATDPNLYSPSSD
jgi:hypothetical protein